MASWQVPSKISAVTQKVALEIDSILMDRLGYSLIQLMELAGLSASMAINDMYKRLNCDNRKVLVCSGPGNNGGDGLVISRHLSEFGFKTTLFYPKIGQKDIYKNLLLLLDSYDVKVLNELPKDLMEYGMIIDALFGISFRPPMRKPFDTIIENLANANVPIISIDTPSGWNVDEGM
ncbi:conserved hypothetical protein [Theileria equi strain WA]|uniref:NAD(P)H-hydrate epimerase n=1 Tax=Theileria equi strain WA TaxID=1537102 RepID=L1LDC8_THEEQ|nr:conserved hypothetical protein [Theileria equi strain WA]EKX73452.1 conserved hypothetical protein [Theileria equi strain WA]|eukprot:XP_004832904.1 conserved hypothetical protein [Theileria equi strain WA]